MSTPGLPDVYVLALEVFSLAGLHPEGRVGSDEGKVSNYSLLSP